MKRRVFVVGWDGATLDLARPWAEAGLLPNLRRVLEQGACGLLRSTIPPITPVAWLSFSTGRNPGQHGVFDFLRPPRHYTDVTPTAAALSHEPTLWNRLSRAGRKPIVVNVPMTYPAERVDGVIISGAPSPSGGDSFAYPPHLLDELSAQGWDLTRDATLVHGTFDNYFYFLRELVEHRTAAVCYLMDRYPWDFFMVHYLETDQAQHLYWRFMGDGGPNSDAILKIYQAADAGLGQIMERLPPDVSLVVLSDHGLGPTRYHVHLNNWLAREGFLVWKRAPATFMRRALYSLGLDPTSVYSRLPSALIRKLPLDDVRVELAQVDKLVQRHKTSYASRLRKTLLRIPFLNFDDVDWQRTAAYAYGTTQAGLIYLNVKGREAQGMVQPGADYERVRARVADRLLTLVDPYSGELLVRQVLLREDLYKGDRIADAPDLIVIYRSAEYDNKKGTAFLSRQVVDRVQNTNATHRLMGMVALMGPQVRAGLTLPEVNMLDLAPTIMALMGEPIPEEFEGRVLHEALTEPSQISTMKRDENRAYSGQEDLSAEELDQVLDKLRALGYVD